MNNLLFDTSIPAPSVCDWFVELLDNNILWSLISNVDEFIIVLEPSICNPPRIITNPVSLPYPLGSIIKLLPVYKVPPKYKSLFNA